MNKPLCTLVLLMTLALSACGPQSGPSASSNDCSLLLTEADVLAAYEAAADGVQYIPRMSTTVPYTEDDCVSTVRGAYCGYDQETLLHQYPKAVRLDAAGYDGMYVYEPLGTKHIAFYIKDGVVVKIEMENLIDSRLLSESLLKKTASHGKWFFCSCISSPIVL